MRVDLGATRIAVSRGQPDPSERPAGSCRQRVTGSGWSGFQPQPGGGSPLLRYWNGESWTEYVAPGSPPAPLTTAQPQKVEWLALVLSLSPLIGILGGLISMARGSTSPAA